MAGLASRSYPRHERGASWAALRERIRPTAEKRLEELSEAATRSRDAGTGWKKKKSERIKRGMACKGKRKGQLLQDTGTDVAHDAQ